MDTKTRRRKQAKPQPKDRRLGVMLLSAGAAALGLGAALAAVILRRRPADGHAAPDLAPDATVAPVTTAPSNRQSEVPEVAAEARAPDHFRPDPTAVPSADERESLRPATGHAPGFSADRGSVQANPQDAA